MTLLLGIFTFILVLVSLFMVLVILAQRAKSDGGVGAALGGGVTEAAFGAESGNVLSKATTWSAVIFFVLSFGLYLGHLHQHRHGAQAGDQGLPVMPDLSAPGAAGEVFVPPADNALGAPAESVVAPSADPEVTPSADAPAVEFPSVDSTVPESAAPVAPDETTPNP